MLRVMQLAFVVAIGSSAAAQGPSPLKPVSQWRLASDAEKCVIFQRYSDGKDRPTLAFKARPTSDYVLVQLEIPDKNSKTTHQKVTVDVGGGVVEKPTFSIRSTRPDYRLHEFGFSGDEVRALAASQRLAIDGWRYRLALPVTGLDGALADLRKFSSELLARWGMSKEDQARVAQWPQPEKPFVHWHDYPVLSIRLRQIGGVEARATIHPDGSTSDCHIVQSSSHKELDQATCQVIKKARFKPAIDRNGKPMISLYYYSIRWGWWR